MKETFICELEKHQIYYLSNELYGFYIAVPKNSYKETNLTFRLKSNYEIYNINKNPIENIKQELVNYYGKVDNYNITLILPIFYDETLFRITTVRDMDLYHKIDRCLGNIFNEAYKILIKSGIEVKSNIYVINNDSFKDFINWFVARYNNRVEYRTMFDLLKETDNFSNCDLVETPSINFVVGRNEVPDFGKTVQMETETFSSYADDEAEKNNSSIKERSESNAGFVSYVFLGVTTFIVSLILLFMLVK